MINAIGNAARGFLRPKTPSASIAQTMIVKVIGVVLSLSAGVITARSLGPAGRGDQSAIGIWPWLIAGFATVGVPAALRYHVSRDRSAHLLLPATILAGITGLVAAVLGAAFIAQTLSHRYGAFVVLTAEIMMLFVPVMSIFRVFCAYFEAQGDFSRSNRSSLVSPAITLGLIAALWAAHRLNPETANYALFLPFVVQVIYLGYQLRHSLAAKSEAWRRQAMNIVTYGLRGYGSEVMGTLALQADQAVIVAFLTPSALGLYTVALTASRAINLFQDSLNAVLFPTASGLKREAALYLVARAARVSSIISAAIIIVLMAIIPIILPLFYGPAFAGAALITRILLIEAFLRGVASVLVQGFLATGRPGLMTIIQAAWLCFSVAFLIILVPRLGIAGAAWALTASSFVRLIGILACYPLVLHEATPRLVPTSADFDYLRMKLSALRRP